MVSPLGGAAGKDPGSHRLQLCIVPLLEKSRRSRADPHAQDAANDSLAE